MDDRKIYPPPKKIGFTSVKTQIYTSKSDTFQVFAIYNQNWLNIGFD